MSSLSQHKKRSFRVLLGQTISAVCLDSIEACPQEIEDEAQISS
jgi:hypothetical protein